ncbi:unnamed protein product [Triticum turgidum subsp. durum]|uniref:DUF3700 domain-containing protein n=1 Tax=Triticum turgidum subsp. durum TaxID=4567 RepID=A0A9R0TX93_TRITD|nr:unnamed protein product [Triticum turgidum subsp. durum]
MVAEDLGFLDEQRALYQSMRNTHEIRRERWWLRILRVERYVMFIETSEEVQATADGASSVSATPPPRFAPCHHDHEAGPFSVAVRSHRGTQTKETGTAQPQRTEREGGEIRTSPRCWPCSTRRWPSAVSLGSAGALAYSSANKNPLVPSRPTGDGGCFYTTSGGLQSFEHPLNELKAVPRVDSQGQMCGSTFKVDSEAKKDSGIPRVVYNALDNAVSINVLSDG